MAAAASETTLHFAGAKDFRMRVVLACLARRPIVIERIRASDESPGVSDYEASLIHMLDKLTNGTKADINSTGTRLRLRPGVLTGGSFTHDCPTSRAIGYWLEPLLLLAPFCKTPVRAVLTGLTNDALDVSVDRMRSVVIPTLRVFGIDGVKMAVKKRGAPPKGGGLVTFQCPVVRELTPVSILEEGFVRRVRGVAFSTRVSPQVGNRTVASARALLNKLLPDVYINTDHVKGPESGLSPGFALALVAESTSGCLASAEAPVGPGETPEELGARVSRMLCDELSRGGCIDTDTSPLALVLMALTPPDVSRIRLGRLSPRAVSTLRLIDTVLGVRFRLRPEPKGTLRKRSDTALGISDEAAKALLAGRGMSEAVAEVASASAADRAAKKRSRAEAEAEAASMRKGRRGADGRDDDDQDDNEADAAAAEAEAAALAARVEVAATDSVVVSCVGMGFRNMARSVT